MINIYSSTLTSKGQATIPLPIRQKLGIKSGEKVLFEKKGKAIVIKPAEKEEDIINNLYGSLKTNIKWNKKKAHEAIGKMLAKEYLKTLK